MTAKEIKEYEKMVQGTWSHWFQKTFKDNYFINFHGYTSCSLEASNAMSFAWEDMSTGNQKVLFHIKWKCKGDAYFLDAGAFDHEKEVLLFDGVRFLVESVEKIKQDK